MAIYYQIDGVDLPSIANDEVSKWIEEVVVLHAKELGDISYVFCDDEKILEVNNQYLSHDYYTDIISFDYTEENEVSGDLLISVDTVKSNAEQFGVSYLEELHRVIIHGILHLCGINDKSEAESKQMRICEDEALTMLRDKAKYPKTELN